MARLNYPLMFLVAFGGDLSAIQSPDTGPWRSRRLDRMPAGSKPGTPQRVVGWRQTPTSPHGVELALDGSYSDCLRTLGPLLDIELNSLVVLERSVAASLYFCVVDEHICCAAVRSDKTEAFFAVKPFHSSLCHTFNFSHFERMPTGIPA